MKRTGYGCAAGEWGTIALLAVLFTVTAHAATLNATWNDGTLGGWQDEGEGSVTNPSTLLAIRFDAQASPRREAHLVWRDVDEQFLVTNISFRLLAENRTPSELRVTLHSRHSGLAWQVYMPPPPPGEWATYSVPIQYPSGWTLGPATSAIRFHNDAQNVDWVGISLTRSGATEQQSILVDDFVMEGHILSDIVDPADDRDGDGMPDAWEERHGLLAGDPADAADDADGDGMRNDAEYRAGTDPNSASSIFRLQTAARRLPESPAAVAVTWESVRYRRYALWKSTNLVEGFWLDQPEILTTPPQNTYLDADVSADGSTFYRVGVIAD